MSNLSGIGSIIGGASGILGSIAGSIGQASTNRTNLQIARETNEMNYRIAQEANAANYKLWQSQNDANINFWKMENDYNDAQSQRQRLEEAGLNPYLMMSGGSAGSASSLNAGNPNPTVVPSMQGATVQNAVNTDNFAKGMELLSQQLYNYKMQKLNENKAESEIEHQNIINTYLPFQMMHQNKSFKMRSLQDELTYQWMKQTQQARIDEQKERSKIAHQEMLYRSAQVIGQSLSNNAQQILNNWLPAQKSAEYMEQLARIANTKADTSAKYAQIRYVTAQTLGVNIQNKIAQEVSESAIKATKAFNNYQQTLYGGSVFGLNKGQIDLHQAYKGLTTPFFNTIGFDGDAGFSISGPKGSKGNQKKKKTKDSIEVGVGASGSQSRIDTYDPRNGWDYYLPLGSEFDSLF